MSFVSTFNHTNSMTDNIIDRDKLQEDMINRIIDGMDIDGLCQLAYDYLNENYVGEIWEADNVDDLIEEITNDAAHCILSIDYQHVLK